MPDISVLIRRHIGETTLTSFKAQSFARTDTGLIFDFDHADRQQRVCVQQTSPGLFAVTVDRESDGKWTVTALHRNVQGADLAGILSGPSPAPMV